jgi:peptidoglycan/LPS O-acetylase OafA/YrhL
VKPKIGSLSNNIQIIDLVRSLSILSVLAWHLQSTLARPDAPAQWFWIRISSNGVGGVFMFFVVSGFLITRIIDLSPGKLFDSSWKNFYARRIGRIIPLFLLHVFLGLAVMLTVVALDDVSPKFRYCFDLPLKPLDPLFWFSLFTFTFNWVGAFCIGAWQGIGAHWSLLWSLCVEEQFYLFYPLVLRLLGNRKNLFFVFIPLAFACFFWRLAVPTFGFGEKATAISMYLSSYGLITEGILLYLACKQYGRFLIRYRGFCLVMVILGFFMLAFSYSHYLGEHWIYRDIVIGPGLFLFLLGGIHLNFFESRYFRWMALPGKYSYGCYLLHIIVLYFIHSVLWGMNALLAFTLYAGLATFVAAGSYHFFEIPSNRFVRRLFGVK